MDIKWICPYCGDEQTKEKPKTYCLNCHKGRYQEWHQCECGKWFHPDRLSKKYCSQECHYKYMPKGGTKGKHYPHTQRARIAVCPVCGKEVRAIHEYKGRKSVYCSKECWAKRGKRVKRIVRTPEFRKWKSEVFKRDNFTCQMCGAKTMLEAHHIKEKVNFPELEYDVDNGICLCNDCHRKTDNYGYKAKIKKAVLLHDDR